MEKNILDGLTFDEKVKVCCNNFESFKVELKGDTLDEKIKNINIELNRMKVQQFKLKFLFDCLMDHIDDGVRDKMYNDFIKNKF